MKYMEFTKLLHKSWMSVLLNMDKLVIYPMWRSLLPLSTITTIQVKSNKCQLGYNIYIAGLDRDQILFNQQICILVIKFLY